MYKPLSSQEYVNPDKSQSDSNRMLLSSYDIINQENNKHIGANEWKNSQMNMELGLKTARLKEDNKDNNNGIKSILNNKFSMKKKFINAEEINERFGKQEDKANKDDIITTIKTKMKKEDNVKGWNRLKQAINKVEIKEEDGIKIDMNNKKVYTNTSESSMKSEIIKTLKNDGLMGFGKQVSIKNTIRDSYDPETFSIEDLKFLKQTIEKEQEELEKEIKQISQIDNKVELKLSKNTTQKWQKAKQHILALSRVRNLSKQVRLYGTSVNLLKLDANDVENLKQFLVKNQAILEKKNKKRKWFLIYPESTFNSIWAMITFLLIPYIAFCIPLKVVFFEDISETIMIIGYIFNAIFGLNMVIQVFSINDENYNDSYNVIARNFCNYAKTWLIPDILSIFPFEAISKSHNIANYFSLIMLLRIPALSNIVRFATISKLFEKMKFKKISKYLKAMEDYLQFNMVAIRICNFCFTILIIVNFIACMWYLLAKIQDFSPDTWVYQQDLLDANNLTLYITSIYWAVVTLSTVGYGDIRPFNTYERIFAIAWMASGALFYSLAIGTLSSILANLDTRQSHLMQKLRIIDEFAKEAKLDKELTSRVKKALEYHSLKNVFSQSERNEFFHEIPVDLKFQISDIMHKGIATKLAFFKNKDKVFVASVVPLLEPVKISKGEYIFKTGEYPNLVYFLICGRVGIVVGNNNLAVKTYVSGSYFGEIEILKNIARMNTIRAETDCDMLTLSRTAFLEILEIFPHYAQELRDIGEQRILRNQEAFRKIKKLIPITKQSTFWEKHRRKSLYITKRSQNLLGLDDDDDVGIRPTKNSDNQTIDEIRKLDTEKIIEEVPSEDNQQKQEVVELVKINEESMTNSHSEIDTQTQLKENGNISTLEPITEMKNTVSDSSNRQVKDNEDNLDDVAIKAEQPIRLDHFQSPSSSHDIDETKPFNTIIKEEEKEDKLGNDKSNYIEADRVDEDEEEEEEKSNSTSILNTNNERNTRVDHLLPLPSPIVAQKDCIELNNKDPLGFSSKDPFELSKSPTMSTKDPAMFSKSPTGLAKSTTEFTKDPTGFIKDPPDFTKDPADFTKDPPDFTKDPQDFNKDLIKEPSTGINFIRVDVEDSKSHSDYFLSPTHELKIKDCRTITSLFKQISSTNNSCMDKLQLSNTNDIQQHTMGINMISGIEDIGLIEEGINKFVGYSKEKKREIKQEQDNKILELTKKVGQFERDFEKLTAKMRSMKEELKVLKQRNDFLEKERFHYLQNTLMQIKPNSFLGTQKPSDNSYIETPHIDRLIKRKISRKNRKKNLEKKNEEWNHDKSIDLKSNITDISISDSNS